jgi:hypothetical protein
MTPPVGWQEPAAWMLPISFGATGGVAQSANPCTHPASTGTAQTSQPCPAVPSVVTPPAAVPPTITGTVSGQTTTSETPKAVFSGVTIADTNNGGANTNTLTITYSGPGTLAGTGLAGSAGDYTISGTGAAITTDLRALLFTPVNGVPGTSVTTTFTLSDLSPSYGTPTTDSTTTLTDTDPTTGNVVAPAVPQPSGAGQVVGFILRNNSASSAIPAHYVTFGEVFASGAVPSGSHLTATIGTSTVNVQMDVQTAYPDGSAKMAVLTLLQPAMAASASLNGMLNIGSYTPGSSVSLASAQSVVVAITTHNTDGSTTNYSFNGATLLASALSGSTATILRQGPFMTTARFTAPVAASFYLNWDVTAFADGTYATDVAFDNDIAMASAGGAVTYDVTVTKGSSTVLTASALSQIQYQNWNQTFWSNAAPQVQVIHDIAALEATGAIPGYDTTSGVDSGILATYAGYLGGSTYGILGSGSVTQYMGQTGGRDDIGPQPAWNAIWLMSQDPTALAYALAQVNIAAGSIPWHFVNLAPGGGNLTLTEYPNIWTDSRATNSSSQTALTQQIYLSPNTNVGWHPDPAHQPDMAHIAWLMTGSPVYLDEVTAQAANSEIADYNAYRGEGNGYVANGLDQVRQQAWSLRQIDEAAFDLPDSSPLKSYFVGLMNANWAYLVSQIPTWTAAEGGSGAPYGYLPGNYGPDTETVISPWEQDYFVSTAFQAAQMGNANALTFLEWESNFIVGRFLQASNGFPPQDGCTYNLTVGNSVGPLTTWAAVEAASTAAGQTNGSGWAQSNGDYCQLALESLSGILTVSTGTLHSQAQTAYNWLVSSGAPQLYTDYQFRIVPR